MNHNKKTPLDPINTSSSEFGVMYENKFIVLDDAKHVIGVDPKDGNNLIIENVETGKADTFQWGDSYNNLITTLVYHKDMGSFYSGDTNGHLYKYKVQKTSKISKRIKAYGDIGIGEISSSLRFMQFFFLEGIKVKSES